MSKLKSPEVNISFVEKGESAIQRGERGIVALGLQDKTKIEPFTAYSVTDIPKALSEVNTQYIKDALQGYVTAPKKVIVYTMQNGAEKLNAEYTAMLKYFAQNRFDYLAIPTVKTDGKTNEVVTWIKNIRIEQKLKRKAVLPEVLGDNEGIINVNASLTRPDGTVLTPEQVTPRIAGLICGTPLSISITYAPLKEFIDCQRFTKQEADEAVGAGKLIFMYDGEKVKVNRGVNSLTTTNELKGDSFKKIKIVEIMDMIYEDIRRAWEDTYVGRYANTYDNKCLLITAINSYFAGLIRSNLLSKGECYIDLDGQRDYLKQQGKDVNNMSEQDLKEENTGSRVFLRANISILDAMEDMDLEIYL